MARKLKITVERFGKQLAVLELNEAQIPLNFHLLTTLTRLVTLVKKIGPLVLINVPVTMRVEGSISSGFKTGEVLIVPSSRSLAVVTEDKETLPFEVYKAGCVKDGLENILKISDGTIVTLHAELMAEEQII
ncbi:MAG: hypothetical protein LM590_14310 [Thermofilum sp.]|nr:hypothetical protein [Thermofilum sp.]